MKVQPRLVAFGCSHTYGEGMPDNYKNGKQVQPYHQMQSKFAWPEVLGKKLGLPVVNYGKGGASNKYACKKVLDTPLNDIDIVVFLWTYFSRTCFWDEDGNPKRITPENGYWHNLKKDSVRNDIKFCNTYYKNFFSYYNTNIEAYQQINFAKLYLDSKGIKNYHVTCQDLPFTDLTSGDTLLNPNTKSQLTAPHWNTVDLRHQPLYDRNALDSHHPSISAHEKIAEDIYKIITE